MKNINDLSRHTGLIAKSLEGAVMRVLHSGWYVLGPEVERFEREFAAYCESKHCVSLANGTDAIELALRSLGIGPESKVLTVANAGMYSTAAITATGATPTYADIDPDTALVAVADLARLVTSRKIDAIIVTHLYGLLADVKHILEIADTQRIPVLEDCAQAHGARAGGKAGTFGAIGCFSFYPTKNLGALGDGGAIVTNRDDLAERVRQLRQYGWESKYRAKSRGGCNSRLDELQAAVLRVKLPLLDGWNVRRREIANRYSSKIRHANIAVPPARGEESVAHLYVIKVAEREALREFLMARGIPTDVHYPIPDYRQPCYAGSFPGMSLPETELHCAQALTLPCFPEMTDGEVDTVVASLNAWTHP